MGTKHLFGVSFDRFLHAEGGIAGAHRVVLVRQRRTEQRHDAVAHDLVDGALVAVDGLHHLLEHGVEELPCLLGIAVGEQLHRTLQVGEEDGDLLALAFEGGLRGEDPLGEVPGSVRVRGSEALSCWRSGHRLPARETEGGLLGQLRVAFGARQGEAGSALHTEVRLSRILLMAPGTRHAMALQSRSRQMSRKRPEPNCAASPGQGYPRANASDLQHRSTQRYRYSGLRTVPCIAWSKRSARKATETHALRALPRAENATSERNDCGKPLLGVTHDVVSCPR